ncbi:MAG: hypothetical protein B9S33_06170 [Pedosphaera sp. Tous-C6FEB]|nr:MAG: hypothetical protein B9S33_06170 [Pedosphaera sp. Tous-C6FEB]
MQTPELPPTENEQSPSAPVRKVVGQPDFSGTPQPIGQLTEQPDFPQCALGVHVSIHGFAGVVVEIVNQSIKVISAEGITQRFNAQRLKTLFAPPDRTKPAPEVLSMERPKPVAVPRPVSEEEPAAPPARVYIAEPDFTAPVQAIRTYATQPDFPQCAYGKHVEIPGYAGVVVEIVKGSLKVKSPTGTIRSYSADTLVKLYGRP